MNAKGGNARVLFEHTNDKEVIKNVQSSLLDAADAMIAERRRPLRPESPHSTESMLRKADRALYAAKVSLVAATLFENRSGVHIDLDRDGVLHADLKSGKKLNPLSTERAVALLALWKLRGAVKVARPNVQAPLWVRDFIAKLPRRSAQASPPNPPQNSLGLCADVIGPKWGISQADASSVILHLSTLLRPGVTMGLLGLREYRRQLAVGEA